MKLVQRHVTDVLEFQLEPRRDHRGYFMRTYDQASLAEHGLAFDWLQENESKTVARNTVRGLHFQYPPSSETKLIRVLNGAILDVFVDIRRGSPSWGRFGAVELSAEKANMLLIPRGFAHGFCSLSDDAVLAYKVDSRYAPDREGGVRWDDPDLGIPWPTRDPILSDRDRALPLLRDIRPFE